MVESNPTFTHRGDRLANRIEVVSDFAASILGQPLIPPSRSLEEVAQEIDETPMKQFCQTYSERLRIFRLLYMAQKTGSKLPEATKREATTTLQLLNNIDTYAQIHRNQEDNRTLWDPQFTAFEKLSQFLEAGARAGYIKHPAGSGKTVLFTKLVEAVGVPTLIAVSTLEGIDQTVNKFFIFAPSANVGVIYHKQKQFGNPVTVITYHSLIRQIDKAGINPQDYPLLILDEGHRMLGRNSKRVVSRFTSSIRLGFTATPAYAEDKQLSRELGPEIHGISIKEAVEMGSLCDFRVWIANSEIDISNVSVRTHPDGKEFDQKELDKAINTVAINKAAVDLYQARFIGKSLLINCSSVKQARDVARRFQEQEITATAVYSKMPGDRRATTEAFKEGKIPVLTQVKALDETFDAPIASVCFNLAPSVSPLRVEQRVRVLRLNPKDQEKIATIVEFVYLDVNRREKQILFSEVAEGALMRKKSKETIPHDNINETLIDSEQDTFDIEGIRIITKVDEIMEITAKSRTLRSTLAISQRPEGLSYVNLRALSSEFGVSTHRTVGPRLRVLAEQNPGLYWIEGYVGSKNYATEEGLTLLREDLEKSFPRGLKRFSPLLMTRGKGLPITYRTVEGILAKLAQEHPDDFKGTRGIRLATPEGIKMFEEALKPWEEPAKPPELFTEVLLVQLAQQFDSDPTTVARDIKHVQSTNPEDVKIVPRRGVNSKANNYSLSPKGLELLQGRLNKRGEVKSRQQELAKKDFIPFPRKQLSDEFGLDPKHVGTNYLTKWFGILQNEYPDQAIVIESAGGEPLYYLTNAALEILKKRLTIK